MLDSVPWLPKADDADEETPVSARARAQSSFFHGFSLPFRLLFQTLRHPTLGLTYLKLICIRALVAGGVAALVFSIAKFGDNDSFAPKVSYTDHGKGKGKPGEKAKATVGFPLVKGTPSATFSLHDSPSTPSSVSVPQTPTPPKVARKLQRLADKLDRKAHHGGAAGAVAPSAAASADPSLRELDDAAEKAREKVQAAGKAAAAAALRGDTAGAERAGEEAATAANELDRAATAATEAHAKHDAEADGETDAEDAKASPAELAPAPPKTKLERIKATLQTRWKWILWFIGIFSTVEAILAAFSRRWDDFVGFHTSLLAGVVPEDRQPVRPKLGVDFKWLFKKGKRRLRGYMVFAAGVPMIALFKLVPAVGDYLFSAGLTLWGWYWLTVFTAAKSGHAWAEDGFAPSPFFIRELHERTPAFKPLAPLRFYLATWGKLTKSVNAPATLLERRPAAFMGLAAARLILSLPMLYLLARPMIPVAAGRLCAEADPHKRFLLQNA